MLKVYVDNLVPGMVVARCVFNADGLLMLNTDMVLTHNYIQRLKTMAISSVYIKDIYLDEIDIPEVICEQTRVNSIKAVKDILEKTKLTDNVNVKALKLVAKSIVDEVLANRNTLIHLSDIRGHDDYTFGHSVNVCILSTIIGLGMGYTKPRLRELALGGLMHDLGKMMIPKNILNKPDKLTGAEIEVIRHHSDIGFDILRKQEDMPLLSAHVAFQHHEKFDGSGYPRGLGEYEIHEYARIAAIADVYDALTSDRAYCQGMLPYDAYRILAMSAKHHFDGKILEVFASHIAIYPVGTIVELNNGYRAVVIKVIPGYQLKPVIKLILDKSGEFIKDGQVINLINKNDLFVINVLSADAVIKLGGGDIFKQGDKERQEDI